MNEIKIEAITIAVCLAVQSCLSCEPNVTGKDMS